MPDQRRGGDEHRGSDERRLALGAVGAVALLAPVAAAFAAYAAGWAGVASALIGLLFVLVLFGVSAALLAWLAARNPTRGMRGVGVLVGAAMVRLPLYAAALYGLSQLTWIHRPSLALATVSAIALTLAYELKLMNDLPRLFWLDTAAVADNDESAGPAVQGAGSPPTRSQPQ